MFCLLSTGTTALTVECHSLATKVVWWRLACLSGTTTVSGTWGCLVMTCLLSTGMTVCAMERHSLAAGVVWQRLACCLQWWRCWQWTVVPSQLGLSGDVLPVVCSDKTVCAVDSRSLMAMVIWRQEEWDENTLIILIADRVTDMMQPEHQHGDGYLETRTWRRMRWE